MESWDYAHCLPYFKRMENCLARRRRPFRGHDGPLVLERGPATGPLFDAFFAAVQQAGYPLTADVNGYRQEGFAAFDRNIHEGRRLRAARAYLHPVMSRPNLEVETLAFATRILFDGDARRRRRVHARGGAARVRREAGEIISAAARSTRRSCSSSPASAPPTSSRRSASTSSTTCPGVGENLQDHLEVYIQHACTAAGLDGARASRSGEPADGRRSSGCCAGAARARPTTSRRAASSAATTRSPTRT